MSAAFISATAPNRTYNYSSPNPSNESDLIDDGLAADANEGSEVIMPCKLEFDFYKIITPSGASIPNSLTLDNMIAGSSDAATYSSREIYSSLISMAAVPTPVADLKTFKVAAVPSFISKLQTNITIFTTDRSILAGSTPLDY